MTEHNMDIPDDLSGLENDLAANPPDMTPLVLRQMLWDMTPHPEVPEALRSLGLTLGSDEGIELEHAESDARLGSVMYLVPAIAGCAELAAKVYSGWFFDPVDPADLPGPVDEIRARFDTQNTELVASATLAILTQLISVGALAPTHARWQW